MNNECKPYFIKSKVMHIKDTENHHEEAGYLDISVFNLSTQIPLKNALVRVSSLIIEGLYNEIGKGKYYAAYRTDIDGEIPLITLPVITKDNEMYVLSVNADGYHSAYILDIPIYPDITTSYKIYMDKITDESNSDFEFYLQPQISRHTTFNKSF